MQGGSKEKRQGGRDGRRQGKEAVSESEMQGGSKEKRQGGRDERSQGREAVSERVKCRDGVKKRDREGGMEGVREGKQCQRE